MKELPLLGMGTWGMGGTFEQDTSKDAKAITALRYGLDIGITLIDTAEFYGAGHTEEIVGKAITPYSRSKLFIISKVWKTNLHYGDVLKSANESLGRLKTDYIDLYLIHWPNMEIPLRETVEAMEHLYEQGKVHAIGVSNFSAELMEEAQTYLKNARLFANEIEYNLMERAAEQETIPYCNDRNIKVIAYRPFAKGKLTGTANDLLNRLTKKYNKTLNQITLNWLTTQGITAIPKSLDLSHIKENAGAVGWKLDHEDIGLLRTLDLSN